MTKLQTYGRCHHGRTSCWVGRLYNPTISMVLFILPEPERREPDLPVNVPLFLMELRVGVNPVAGTDAKHRDALGAGNVTWAAIATPNRAQRSLVNTSTSSFRGTGLGWSGVIFGVRG